MKLEREHILKGLAIQRNKKENWCKKNKLEGEWPRW